MKALHNRDTIPKSFIVADLETVLVEEVHFPYAAGFLLVGADIASLSNQMYHIHITADYGELLNFKEKSDNIMHLFNKELKDTIRCNKGVSVVYFHNLSRFDGII